MTVRYLDHAALGSGLKYLSKVDKDLAEIVRRYGPPPLWAREEGFATLIQIILEQQVSLASARAAYERLLRMTNPLTPDTFLDLSDHDLLVAGFSRQKTAYGRNVARAIREGRLDLTAFTSMNDSEIRSELIKIKGIGNWTADIYLLMAMGRPDIWPLYDLALQMALKMLRGLSRTPGPREMELIGENWRPWRAVAARILWHYYLSCRNRKDA